jgi:hypothetical protein
LIDKFKTQRSSKIEILKQLKYHVDVEKEKVRELNEKQFVEQPMLYIPSAIPISTQDAVTAGHECSITYRSKMLL